MSDEPEAETVPEPDDADATTEDAADADAVGADEAVEPEAAPADETADAVGAEADEGEAREADESEADEAETGIENGDFVRLDYTVRTVEEGTVVDTTRKAVAEEADIDAEEYDFSPRVIVVGAGHVFQAVDEALVGADPGDTGTVTIPAAEAFGEFDPDDVRTVSAEKIDEDDRYPGARVTIDGQQGYVETIIGKRARVDFNHPLAGEDLEYDYEIVDEVDDRVEKAEGLLGMYLQSTPEVWIQTDEVEEEVQVESEDDADEDEAAEAAAGEEVADEAAADEEATDEEAEPETEIRTVEKETLYIEATPQMTMNQQWLFSKQQIAQELMNRLDLDRVIVQETIEGMGGMMGGMGGMMGGMGAGGGGGASASDIEDAIEDVDVDPEELVDELDVEE